MGRLPIGECPKCRTIYGIKASMGRFYWRCSCPPAQFAAFRRMFSTPTQKDKGDER